MLQLLWDQEYTQFVSFLQSQVYMQYLGSCNEDIPLLWRGTSGLLRSCQQVSWIWHTYARVVKIKTEAMLLQLFHFWNLIKHILNISVSIPYQKQYYRISSATEFPQQTGCTPAPSELTPDEFIIKADFFWCLQWRFSTKTPEEHYFLHLRVLQLLCTLHLQSDLHPVLRLLL